MQRYTHIVNCSEEINGFPSEVTACGSGNWSNRFDYVLRLQFILTEIRLQSMASPVKPQINPINIY